MTTSPPKVPGWTDLKAIVAAKNALLRYAEAEEIYRVFAVVDDVKLAEAIIYKGIVPLESGVDQGQNDTDKADFEGRYKDAANKSVVQRTSDGYPRSVVEPRTGSEMIVVTHNFCDPTTWYVTSKRIDDQALTDSGDGLTWKSPDAFWIDMVHGKLFDEDAEVSQVSHGYAVVVTVDGAPMTQREPYAASGGDYSVNYAAGSATFFASQTGKVVVASYSRMVDSRFTLAPAPGRRVDIEAAEVQFSRDIEFKDFIEFEAWAYNPADLPNKAMVEKTTYKRMANFIDEALGSYPLIPPIGGSTQGTTQEVYGFPFRYGTIRTIRSSQGVEVRVRLKNDRAFVGEHATATFYCTTRAE